MFNAHRAVWGLMREAGAGWEEVAHNLEKMEGVVSVFTVSGEVDLMLEIVARDMRNSAVHSLTNGFYARFIEFSVLRK